MVETTVELGGVEVRVTKDGDSYEAERVEPSFTEYLSENVFTNGGYVYEEKYDDRTKVAEMDDGSGYVMPEDLQRAIDDGEVDVEAIHDGWLIVKDCR